jgi:hypothetical protein
MSADIGQTREHIKGFDEAKQRTKGKLNFTLEAKLIMISTRVRN